MTQIASIDELWDSYVHAAQSKRDSQSALLNALVTQTKDGGALVAPSWLVALIERVRSADSAEAAAHDAWLKHHIAEHAQRGVFSPVTDRVTA